MKFFLLVFTIGISSSGFSQTFFQQLVGDWAGEAFGGELHTTWKESAEGDYFGYGVFIDDGDTTYSEELRFFSVGKKQYLVAVPSDFDPFIFEAKSISDSEMLFENTNHQNPQKIWYKLLPDGQFYRKTEGIHKDGTPAVNEYFFKKH